MGTNSEGEMANKKACRMSEGNTINKTMEEKADITTDEMQRTQIADSDKEEKKRGRKSRAEILKIRERSNSASIIEYMTDNKIEKEFNFNKRKREEVEKEAELAFKRSNKLERSPTKEKKTSGGNEERRDRNKKGGGKESRDKQIS